MPVSRHVSPYLSTCMYTSLCSHTVSTILTNFVVVVVVIFVVVILAVDDDDAIAVGFTLANFTPYRAEFLHLMHVISPVVFVGFFTLTGAALDLYTLTTTVAVSLALFTVRLAGIFGATYLGGHLCHEPPEQSRVR